MLFAAALEAGADGIDLAASPVSGGTSQPDILTMLHATKGMNYDLGGLQIDKILKYEEVLADCLKIISFHLKLLRHFTSYSIFTNARWCFNSKHSNDER